MARGWFSTTARAVSFLSSSASSPMPATKDRKPLPPSQKTGTWKIEVVKRNELHRFVVLPKRWIVERTLAWISRNRRLARDFERYARTGAAFVRLAMIRIMLRRLTRPAHCS
jgi:hypothetical protein